jgi:hypothetical protein
MPDGYVIEFSPDQCELVKNLIRELLKDGDCAVYPLPHMKPDGELQMAHTSPGHIRADANAAIVIRPGSPQSETNGDIFTRGAQPELLKMIRSWR